MKILLVHNYYKVRGGEDTVFENEKAMLIRHGHEVITCVRHNDDMGIFSLLFSSAFSRSTYREVCDLIDRYSPELIHVHNTQFLISPSVFAAASDRGVTVVQTLHNFRLVCANAMLFRNGHICEECLEHGYSHALKYGCYRHSRFFTGILVNISRESERRKCRRDVNYICLTPFNASLLERSGVPGERIFVKPNFIPVHEPVSAQKVKGRFIYVGRNDELKGVSDIVEQWKRLPAEYELLLCGVSPGDMGKLPENVKEMGVVEHERVLSLMASSNALIFASRWYEGFPMTIIESLSVGTPVIGLNRGNAGSILSSIYGGSDILMKGIEELPERILSFDPVIYRYEDRALWEYTEERNYDMLMNIYSRILSH